MSTHLDKRSSLKGKTLLFCEVVAQPGLDTLVKHLSETVAAASVRLDETQSDEDPT